MAATRILHNMAATVSRISFINGLGTADARLAVGRPTMATPLNFTVNNLNVPLGDNFLPVGGATIPAGYTQLAVRLDLSNWLATDNVVVLASYSTDGGTTWSDQGGVLTTGGVHVAPDLVTPILTGFTCGVPAGTGVKVRAHFIVPSGQKVSGSLTLT